MKGNAVKPPQYEFDVHDRGTVREIVYERGGRTYRHVFKSEVKLAHTIDRQYIVLHGGALKIDPRGWIHG